MKKLMKVYAEPGLVMLWKRLESIGDFVIARLQDAGHFWKDSRRVMTQTRLSFMLYLIGMWGNENADFSSWSDVDTVWLERQVDKVLQDPSAFNEWRKKNCVDNPNFEFWDNFTFTDAPIFDLFVIAIKTGDMRLRTWVRQMVLPLDAAVSKRSKYEYLYVNELWDIIFDMPPAILNHLFQGNFSVQWKNAEEFGLEPLDEVQEAENKGLKSGTPDKRVTKESNH